MRMIVAVDRDNAIGWADGRLPWRSSVDMKRFKELTSAPAADGGLPYVVMGRKTYDSLPPKFKPLPGRRSFVLTRDPDQVAGLIAVGVVPVMTDLADTFFTPDTWLIGGAQLYNSALDEGLVTEIYVTQVHLPGDEPGRLTGASGADVRLKHDLYNYQAFMDAERQRGRFWGVRSIHSPTVIVPEPGVTFVTLERI
jgi:dihydrofolate reductase